MYLIAGRFLASAYLSLEVDIENGIKYLYAWLDKHPEDHTWTMVGIFSDLPLVDIWFSSGVALSQSVITWLTEGGRYE